MRILHLLDHSLPLQSGYASRSHAILTGQRRLGWEVAALTGPKYNAGSATPERVEGIDYYRTPPWGERRPPLLEHGLDVWAMARRLLALAREWQPDLLHAHSPALDGWAALWAGRRLGKPVAYEVRAFWEDAAVSHAGERGGGLRYRLARALETGVARRADGVAAICGGLRDDLLARGVAAERMVVVPNGVDSGFFAELPDGAPLRRQLGLEGALVMGFVGSYYGYEGLALALAALPGLLARHPRLRLLLVGGGPEEAALRRQTTALGLEEVVVFAGRIPFQQIRDYYAVIDLFLYPRLPMRLTDLVTPLKPLEALAAGGLVVASDVGGHRELLDGPCGAALFAAGDREALTASVTALLDQPDSWPERRRQARAWAAEQRAWGAMVARYQPWYTRLLAAGGAA